jgi:phosphate acetyltransferase
MNKPETFLGNLISRCQARPGRVIFPEGDDPRVLEAADKLLNWNAVSEIILISASDSAGTPTKDTRQKIISKSSIDLIKLTVEVFESAQKKKNKTVDAATVKSIAGIPLYQAGALLAYGSGDCVIAGCVATTGDVIRAALSTIGLAPDVKTVSGSFIMERTNDKKSELYIYADCGVVIEPTIEQLVDIGISSCETYQKITGQKPVVAFLSFSTKGSADHPAAHKMRLAADLFRQRAPGIDSDGEMQFDAAYVSDVGRRKAPNSKVPGQANCFIFPDLDAGNIAYKITQRLAGFGAYGPILQGLAKPYSDLSRGASADDIAVSALINIIRSR